MYNLDIINGIKDKLIAGNETIAVAESVTSGHLQAALSLAENATQFFQGGITTYNLGQKCRHLNIDPVHCAACDSVSAEVASAMSKNVCNLFLSNWGIGICGYATPVREKGINDLYVHYSIAYNGDPVLNNMVTAANNGTVSVQIYYTNIVLNELFKLLEQQARPGI